MKRTNFKNQHGYTWINVASGHTVLDDFINLDNNIFFTLASIYSFIGFMLTKDHRKAIEKYAEAKKTAPFLKYDCRKQLPFSDASVDHILCSHFLEHLYPEQASKIITDFKRILKNGGTLHIILPDLDMLIEEYTANKNSQDAADVLLKKILMSSEVHPSFSFRLFEFLGFEGFKHRWMYTVNSMSLKLKSAGFELIKDGNSTPSAQVRAGDGESLHMFARKFI